MNIIHVSTKTELDTLYNQSAFTMEGLVADNENLSALEEWLREHNALTNDNHVFHIITGRLMNRTYGLTGNNAYPDDCTIVSVTGIDLLKLVIPRFEVGGRWFDDIVDNNLSREEEQI